MAVQGLKIRFSDTYSNDIFIALYIFNDYLPMMQNVLLKYNVIFNF